MKCPYCGKVTNEKELIRRHGEWSQITLLGYCSAQCYTKHVLMPGNQPKENELIGDNPAIFKK